VSEELFKRRLAPFTVLATNAGSQLIENLKDALNTPEFRLTVRNGPSTLWEALEMQGADLVVIGFDGTELQGPQLCHVIRSHPRWHRTPILIVGSSDPAHLEEAFAAGSDDYLSATASATECLARVQVQLKRGRLDQVRSDLDPLTGTANRTAAERSMDALLRLAKRKNEPFALALLAVDHLNQIHDAEGSALLDIVLRRLGATLERSFRGEDTVGRWNDDGFAVGIYGATSELASSRMAEVLRAFESDGFVTTSGKVVRYTLSAGVACSPGDGSTLSSLERVAKAALRRAKSGQNRVVVAGERTSDTGPEIFDVVLIEDDDSVADVVSHALGLRNYDFERFSDGAEAARALGDGHVSGRVVLLDVGLPSLDGFGVLRTLRAQGVLDETRVIMLTARSSEAETLRALGLGATEHITKPFSIPVLLGRLDQSLTRSAP
jgi:diguanylate cyclase (GGDEF)-like protein